MTDQHDIDPSETMGDGFVGVGHRPRFPEIPRWAQVADVPAGPLPQVPSLVARRATSPISVDGALVEPDWATADWSAPFGQIADGVPLGPSTSVAFLWDDTALYVGYRVEDHDIRAATTRHHEHVYLRDDDVEVFVADGGTYYELGLNAINTIYEIGWTWLEPLVRAQDFDRLETLLRVDDQFYYARRGGEGLGRLADLGWELPGLRHAVRIDGAVNAPEVRDEGWTVELALPWAGLGTLMPRFRTVPVGGEQVLVQTYRAHHPHDDPEADARMDRDWPGGTHYYGTTLSAMGNTNVHNPERWVHLRLEG